jgi:acyl carrier protein
MCATVRPRRRPPTRPVTPHAEEPLPMTTTRTETERPHIVGIFRRVLEVDDLTDTSDFFEAGGDSLLATRVLSAIAHEYDVELTFDDFVIAPSPAALANLVESLRQ